MATATIKGKPDKKVTSLKAPARGSNNRTMTSTWKVPASMTKDSSETRATDLVVGWKLKTEQIQRTRIATSAGTVNSTAIAEDTISLSKEKSVGTTSASLNLSSFTADKSYTRSSFYPSTKVMLKSVTVSVAGKNSKGKGEAVTATRKFEEPKKPSISAFSFNTSTGAVSTTITTDAGAGYKERYDTKYEVVVYNKKTKTTTTSADTSTTDTSKTVSYNASNYQALDPENEYIRVRVSAYARGYAGSSDTVTKDFYYAFPVKAVIKSATPSSKDSTGALIVKISIEKNEQHPVDSVKLEYLDNVSYEKAEDIPAGAQWSDSGIEDDGKCSAIRVPLSVSEHFVPDRGKYTWVRVKTIHANEAVLYQYSEYKRVDELYSDPQTADTSIDIISVSSGEDRKSAVVELGWNTSGTDDSTGTELSWSTEKDTWRSTKEPEKYEFTWSDGERTVGNTTYHDSAKITIKDLTEGELYYIKARRYTESEYTTYGEYASDTVILNGTPDGVVASCKGTIGEGEPLQVYWSVGGSGLQTKWLIIDSNGRNIKDGEGSVTGTQLSAADVASHAVDGVLTFSVHVSTGSEYTPSDAVSVIILPKPTLTISASTLTAQPFQFTASSSSLCDLLVTVTSQGAQGQFPDGVRTQISGDTIYSGIPEITWSSGSASVSLPSGLDFWDGADYTLNVVAVDRDTGLKSEPAETSFAVNWTRKATDPDSYVTVTAVDTPATESTEHIQAVQITLTAPSGSQSSDVYDIYRMDGPKANLIGKGFPLSKTVTDSYAPFSSDGELFYRVAIRTVDGSVEFADKPYTLTSDTVRFDWQGGTLELPYGNSIGDNYKKSVEFRQHMDGSVDGYWNQNIERGGSYSSSIIKLIQPREVNLARELARYAGAVFVRTANGSAFTADVQVTDLSVKNKAVTAIAVDATEVGLTEEFMLESPYEQAG